MTYKRGLSWARSRMKDWIELIVRFLIALGVVVLILLVSLPAEAQHGKGGRGIARGAPGRPPPPQQEPARATANTAARMTPEPPRQLQRDIHDQGLDLYSE